MSKNRRAREFQNIIDRWRVVLAKEVVLVGAAQEATESIFQPAERSTLLLGHVGVGYPIYGRGRLRRIARTSSR